ncbi:hypothetical protein Sjap_014505 [Stephania japonica]|uniref:Uncharacterized protein n=1 Tax=Stephania japonica TaxID=461633 RepID=A0AAP0IHH3_9MAGN
MYTRLLSGQELTLETDIMHFGFKFRISPVHDRPVICRNIFYGLRFEYHQSGGFASTMLLILKEEHLT